MSKHKLILSLSLLLTLPAVAQTDDDPFGGEAAQPPVKLNAYAMTSLKDIYPVGEPATMSYRTPFTAKEKMVFDAAPIVRFSFYNSMRDALENGKPTGVGIYAAFKPHLRLYNDVSYPVRTPSYRIQLGGQYLWRVRENDLLTVAVESGHYSNGQDGCAFAEGIKDGSAACDSVYQTLTTDADLSALLNRNSGNFSTNLTEIHLNYRLNRQPVDLIPKHMVSFRLGLVYYHNLFWGLFDFGGFTQQDIRIYGRYRWQAGAEYIRYFPGRHPWFLTVGEQVELISGTEYSSINRFRSETTVAVYPVNNLLSFGLFASFIAGHDNYNFRFVDSGNQLAIGICWSPFLPIKIWKVPD